MGLIIYDCLQWNYRWNSMLGSNFFSIMPTNKRDGSRFLTSMLAFILLWDKWGIKVYIDNFLF